MARLPKADLLHVVEDAIHECQRHCLRLTPAGAHPARYQVLGGAVERIARVYIWNLTHGGANRPADEWRVQATGIQRFEPEHSGASLILGWRADLGVFAGFDIAQHRGELGTSPSLQVREAALHRAAIDGLAVHNKGNGELVIAFRPDFLAAYIDHAERLHATGDAAEELAVLSRIGQEPASVTQDEIENTVAQQRQFAVVSTQRAIRAADFRRRVLTAYGHRCAMCGLALRLLDSAHIVPAARPESSDETANGIALCALHHRAFDRAFVTFDNDYRTRMNEPMVRALIDARQATGLDGFRQALRSVLALPPDRRDRPAPHFVAAGNALRGWDI